MERLNIEQASQDHISKRYHNNNLSQTYQPPLLFVFYSVYVGLPIVPLFIVYSTVQYHRWMRFGELEGFQQVSMPSLSFPEF
jgi:hypothetical protein